MKNLFALFLLVLFVTNFSVSQEKWSIDPRMVSKYPTGKYVNLPKGIENYVNPNKTVRVYQTEDGILIVNPNVRIYPTTSNQQDEVIIVRHPLNPNIMFGSANTTVGSLYSQGVYVTTNGGISWFGSDILNTSVTAPFSDPGPTIDKNGTIIMTTLRTSGGTPMVACYSTNYGTTWSSLYTISSSNSDKNFAGTDDSPSSPYYGRSYCVWSNFSLSSPPAVVSYTTNGGVSWSSMSQINNPPGGHYSQGVDIRTGPNGEVYVCWAAPMSSSPYTEDFVGFAKSTNGGVTWTVTENAYDMNGIRGSLFPTSIRVNGFPRIDVDRSGGARNGWIYIVTAEKNLSPAGSDPDVIIHRSTNGGSTWSSGIRVNQDALNNGKVQFFPAIRVDKSGGINVVYYDNRNTASDSAEVYVSRSIDGGNTWTDIVVSDHRFKPKPEPGLSGYMGDYIGITSGNNKVWPLWMDDRTGNFQAWTTYMSLGPPPQHDITAGPFLSLPEQWIKDSTYNVKAKVTNAGQSNENNVPIKFFVNGAQLAATTINLNAGASDSVSFPWTPTTTGSFTLAIASALANDTNRLNDTVKTTINVQATPLLTIFCDNFSGGTSNWTITNNGGTCLWQTFSTPYPNSYTLPPTSVSPVLSADADECGSGTTLLSTATITNNINCSGKEGVYLEFDNDWNAIDNQDQAIVEVSYNGGSTWSTVISWGGTDVRNTHEVHSLSGATNNPNVKIRFKSIQPGWDWWWTIDNVCIKGYGLTGIVNNEGQIPKTYSLSQNYPNPFNPTTQIIFDLPKQENVSLKIYDVLGKEVATLVNELRSAGIYTISFDGYSLSSGVYFYRLEAGNFVSVKRMVLIK